MYPLMKKTEIRKYIPLAVKLGVSKKSRSSGFMYHFLLRGKKILNEASDHPKVLWGDKRELFIARTLAAYKKKPTLRRKLSLIMWAYMP